MKLYLRYELETVLGVINSAGSVSLTCEKGRKGRNLALCPGLEFVCLWDLKCGELVCSFRDKDSGNATVQCICVRKKTGEFAAGYSDGSIRLWSLEDTENPVVVFNGHSSSITCLEFGLDGTWLAAGSKDTEITIWDIAAEKGLYRFLGHKNQVTCLKFLKENGLNHIMSCSKDGLIKIWDLSTQNCIETLISPHGDIKALGVESSNEKLFFTGAAKTVTVWMIDTERIKKNSEQICGSFGDKNINDPVQVSERAAVIIGELDRYSSSMISEIKISPSGNFVFVSGKDRNIEVFRIATREEVSKKIKKRLSKKKIKTLNGSIKNENDSDIKGNDLPISSKIPRIYVLHCSQRVYGFDIREHPSIPNTIYVLSSLSKNALEFYSIKTDNKLEDMCNRISTLDMPGHREPVRATCLSNDNQFLVSCSQDCVKAWSIPDRQCIKTISMKDITCCEFLPNDRDLLLGSKTGEIHIVNVLAMVLVGSFSAHDEEMTSIDMSYNKSFFITTSKGKSVKIWELVTEETNEQSSLMPVLRKVLNMPEDITCARMSPNGVFLAVALLDNTVKIIYTDTFKLFLSLYGHKLPILSMDISSDSTMIATASMDKTIKLWGLDFGDCRKSFIAHDEAVTQCRFVFGTHYLFSTGRDKRLKYWDADKFEIIMILESHSLDIWSLCVAKYGNFVVTASDDKSIRIWVKTDEQFALHEERSAELNKLYEQETVESGKMFEGLVGQSASSYEFRETEDSREVVPVVTPKTATFSNEGDVILEALEIYETDKAIMDNYYQELEKDSELQPPARNPFVLSLGDPLVPPEIYVLSRLETVKRSALENALLVLPFVKVMNLLRCIEFWVKSPRSLFIVARALFFLLRLNYQQIVTSASLKNVLMNIQRNLGENIRKQADLIGFNIAALGFIEKDLEGQKLDKLYVDKDIEDSLISNLVREKDLEAQERERVKGKKILG